MPTPFRFLLCSVPLLVGLNAATILCAQDSLNRVDLQTWYDFTLYNEYSEQIEFYGDGGYRHIYGVENRWNRFYIRPSIKYAPASRVSFRGGFATFFTDNQEDLPNTLELRPWQGVSVGWPKFYRIRFSHYFRLEQRIFYNTKTWNQSFNMRYRYQFSSRIQPNPAKKEKYVYFPVFWELFSERVDDDSDIFDLFGNENRIGLGIGYTLNKHWKGQFVFIFQRSRSFGEIDFTTSDYLLRFQVSHDLVPMKDIKRVEEQ
jgi:hypothetical protein